MVEMIYLLEYFFILQNNYFFFRIIFGDLFSVYFADPVSILVFLYYFEFIFLHLCKSRCIATFYYMYSHFLVHENNKNTRKIKLLIGSVKYT